MKKFFSMLLVMCIVMSFSACNKDKDKKDNDSTKGSSTVVPSEVSTTKADETTKKSKSVVVQPSTQNVQEGETLTGLKPLKQSEFVVKDAENSAGLKTNGIGYGFGVSKNGKPHEISINNQKYFDSYNALALDTKSDKKVLYLTFDCGYENGNTEKILDTLKKKKVKAAFFVTLPYLKDNLGQDMAVRMIKEGHIVGNHSTTHPVFPTISREKMAQEICMCDNYLRTKFGYTSPYFRFPTGEYSDCSLDLVDSIGYKSVFWSLAYSDYDTKNQPSNEKAFNTITSRIHPGCVMLLHAVSATNANVLGDVIDWAEKNGYEFKTLDDYNWNK